MTLRDRIQRWGVRARVTAAASTVLAAIVIVGAVGLVWLVHHTLVVSLDAAAATRARDISSLIAAGTIPASLPAQADDSSVIQVVGPSNSIVSASANVLGELPILRTPPPVRADATFTAAHLPVGTASESFRVMVHPVTLPGGAGWTYVATSLAQVNAATTSVMWLLVAALPMLILVVGVTVWIAAGRSLKPIDNIRRQADSIGGDLSTRVPVPRSHDEVSRLAVTVNQMLDRLQSAARRQKRFIGDASHELRSPLATLRAEAEISLAQPDIVNTHDALKRVEMQAVRMSAVIDDLLFLATVDEGRQRTSHEQVDLDETVMTEVRRVEAMRSVRVRLARLDGMRMSGSPRDLARMLRNIGDNAVRHARTEVSFSLAVGAGRAVITITNDGLLIPVEDRQRIFDRFTRLDDARSRRPGEGGSGLGLAIAAEIAATHGGHIIATAASGSLQGTENRTAFVITLPTTLIP